MAGQLYLPMHKCGIGAAVNTETPFQDMFQQAVSIQNRGYDGCGFSLHDLDSGIIKTYRGPGRVVNVFLESLDASEINSDRGIFNNRYRTTGDTNPQNLQPIAAGGYVVSHNGNVFNSRRLAEEHGIKLEDSDSDTHVIAQIIRQAGSIKAGMKLLAEEALGAFNLAVMDINGVVGVYRDPWGYHPLFAGRRGKSTYFASEEPGIHALGIYDAEELKPGDLWLTDGVYTDKISIRPSRTKSGFPIRTSICSVEIPYFMNPGGSFGGTLSSQFRENAGARLADLDEFPNDGDTIVVPIMNSGEHYAIGYSERSGIPMKKGFQVNTAMNRLYMEEDKLSVLGVTPQKMARLKNMVVPEIVRGKRVIVTDDTIVRAGTVPELIKDLFDAGAEEVHLRIGTSPIISSCHMGLNHSDTTKLRAATAVENPRTAPLREMEESVRIGIDGRIKSLRYLPMEDFKTLLGDKNDHCFGCFTGVYPVPILQAH
ncbi:MAG: hypothetical protein HYT71_02755 [Candidatus Aenigmarchaeota archaeon]|nr:hypothetical protein [Candidatus Aenigmarchaeota archaeon]